MALDRPNALLIDISPKLLGCDRGILRMKAPALEIVAVSVLTSEHTQIMQERDADNLSRVNTDPGLIDEITHRESRSCGKDGMIADRRAMMMLLR